MLLITSGRWFRGDLTLKSPPDIAPASLNKAGPMPGFNFFQTLNAKRYFYTKRTNQNNLLFLRQRCERKWVLLDTIYVISDARGPSV